SVVQAWPDGLTYCRSSRQIRHPDGGTSVLGYWQPQVVQMNAGIPVLFQEGLEHRTGLPGPFQGASFNSEQGVDGRWIDGVDRGRLPVRLAVFVDNHRAHALDEIGMRHRRAG